MIALAMGIAWAASHVTALANSLVAATEKTLSVATTGMDTAKLMTAYAATVIATSEDIKNAAAEAKKTIAAAKTLKNFPDSISKGNIVSVDTGSKQEKTLMNENSQTLANGANSSTVKDYISFFQTKASTSSKEQRTAKESTVGTSIDSYSESNNSRSFSATSIAAA